MPTVKLSPLFNDQAVTSAGVPASGYKVYTYTAGSSTQLATYTDSTGTSSQTNPIILNANGQPTNGSIWLQSGLLYKLVYTDASDVVIKTYDNISGVNDTSTSTSQWLSSGVTPTYVSATSFTLAGDQTAEFHIGRKVQCTVTAGTVYGTILTSAFSALTTVTLVMDSGSLDSGLSAVNLSILRADHSAVPPAMLITSINGGPIGENRNRIINGDMRIDQRNEGASQTFTAGAALAYCVDKFYGYCTNANVTGQQVTVSGQKRYRFTGAASVTGVGFGQRIRAANTADMAGTTATFICKLSSSSLTSITWTAYYATSNDTFGTLASPTRTQIATGTFTINSTEASYSAQIAVPSAATTGIEIVLTGGALLATQTLTIGDFGFLPSSVTETNFPRRLYEIEFPLCLPYCEKSFAPGTAPAQNVGNNTGEIEWRAFQAGATQNGSSNIGFKATKFGTTTVTLYNTAAANSQARDISGGFDCSGTSALNTSQNGFSITCTGNASTAVGNRIGLHFLAVAEIP